MRKFNGFMHIPLKLLIIAIAGIILFAPFPYYIPGEKVECIMVEGCPSPGFNLGPSLYNRILYKIRKSEESSSYELEDQLNPTSQGESVKNGKISIIPQADVKVDDWNTYEYIDYGITIKHPTTWFIEKLDTDSYSLPTIRIKSQLAKKANITKRNLPHLYLGDDKVYSTAGSVCANQGCEEAGTISFNINGKNSSTSLVEGYTLKDGKREFDFYSFRLTLREVKIELENYSNPMPMNIVGSFRTIEEGQQLANIISTIIYDKD